MKRNNIANVLTASRIFFGAVLMFFREINIPFLIIFCIAELTDCIDGPIARATHSESIVGARLDSVADSVMFIAVGKTLVSQSRISIKYIVWAVVAIAIIILSSIIGRMRFGSFFFIHTIPAKILGFCCLLLPFSIYFVNPDVLLTIICILFSIIAIESLIIQCSSETAEADAKFAFEVVNKQRYECL